jgi:hypothetical protein
VLQREFVSALKARAVLEGESSRAAFTPFLIPVGGPLAHTVKDSVLVTGDAGGFVNGFTAEGIYYAMARRTYRDARRTLLLRSPRLLLSLLAARIGERRVIH